MNWFDFLLMGIIIFNVVSGYSRGMVKQLVSLFGFIIALGLAFLGSQALSGFTARFIDPEKVISSHDILALTGVETAVERIVELAAGVITFIVLLIVFMILFRFFSGTFKWINRIPIVGLLNRIGGTFIGLIAGILITYVILTLFSTMPLQFSVDAVEGSALSHAISSYFPLFTESFKDLILKLYLENVQNGA